MLRNILPDMNLVEASAADRGSAGFSFWRESVLLGTRRKCPTGDVKPWRGPKHLCLS